MRYLYWSECDIFLRELQSSLTGEVREQALKILQTSKLLAQVTYNSTMDFTGFEDCLLQYRMSCDQMEKIHDSQDKDKEQSYIPVLKETVLHEKSMMNQLAKAFEEANKHISDSKIHFKTNFAELTKHAKELEEGADAQMLQIKKLEKQLKERPATLGVEGSFLEGDSVRQSSRRRSSRSANRSAISTHQPDDEEVKRVEEPMVTLPPNPGMNVVVEVDDKLETERQVPHVSPPQESAQT